MAISKKYSDSNSFIFVNRRLKRIKTSFVNVLNIRTVENNKRDLFRSALFQYVLIVFVICRHFFVAAYNSVGFAALKSIFFGVTFVVFQYYSDIVYLPVHKILLSYFWVNLSMGISRLIRRGRNRY